MLDVRCAVFDIDDTLYLERDYVRSGFAAVGRWLEQERGIEGFSQAAWAAFERGVRGNTFNLVLAELGVDARSADVRQLIGIYREHEPAIELLPDARECLDRLANRKVALAGVTDGPLASQQAKARALGLERWLVPLVFTAELGPGFGKPHPRAFELIEKETGFKGAQCAYLADNPTKDFGGPHALGWQTVRVRRVGSLHAELACNDKCTIEIASLEGFLCNISAISAT